MMEKEFETLDAGETAYPLSPMQQGMLINTLRDGQGTEILQIVGKFEEAIDVRAFEAAWQECVAAHPMLRTSFDGQYGERHYQRVRDNIDVPLSVRDDLCGRPLDEQEKALEEFMAADRRRGITLSDPPLMRLTLFKLDSKRYTLVWTFSHAILDGRSFVMILREVLARYGALTSEALEPETVDRADYATYVRWLEAQDWTSSESYWREQLNGLTSPSALGRTAVDEEYRDRTRFQHQCSPGLTKAVREAAEQMDVALSTIVYGAWALILRHYTGRDDIVYGAVRAGRHVPLDHIDTGIGVLINTVPLRFVVESEQTVSTWLQDVRRTWYSLREHEHVPLSQIQAWSEVPAGQNMFESLVVFDRATINEQVQQGSQVNGADRHFRLLQHTSYPLNLYAYGGDSLTLELEFDPARFAHLRMDRMLSQVETVLQEFAAKPHQQVGAVSVMSPADQDELLLDWNDTSRPYDRNESIHAAIAAQAARTPQATALAFKDVELSYQALDTEASKLARYLRQNGVHPGDRVGICLTRSADLVIGLLGILKAGAAYVPLDPLYPSGRLQFMIQDAGLQTIVTSTAHLDALDAFEGRPVVLDRDRNEIEAVPHGPFDDASGGHALAYVIYTSGSTGNPKGVMVSHQNVSNFFAGMDTCITRTEGQDVWLAVTSISFDISVLELFWTLSRGFKVVLQPDNTERKTAEVQASSIDEKPMAPSNGHQSPAALETSSPKVRGGGASRNDPSGREPSNQDVIDFSLFYFSSDEKLDGEVGRAEDKYRLLLEGARFGDRNGFKAVWTPERHFHDFGGLYPNPSVISAAIAAETDRIGIRAGSCVAPLHHPVRIAEDWAVVDNLSGGRVGISFASGWQPDDFVIDPTVYEDRKAVMYERIDQVRALWRGEPLTFSDAKGGETTVRTLPRPVQAELPVWVTAAGNPETFREAGARGANLLTHLLGQTVDELGEKIAIYRAARAEHGFDPSAGIVTIMLHTFVGEDDASVRETVRGPMREYLRSSIGLIKKAAWSFPAFKDKTTGADGRFTTERLSDDDMEQVLDFSFERYYETSGLFGTPERCLEQVEELRQRGVDEIACLLDFGLDAKRVVDHLPLLAEVRQRARRAARSENTASAETRSVSRTLMPQAETDYSIAAQIERHDVTHLQCTPSQARMLMADPAARSALSQLDHLMVGGEALPVELAKRLRSQVPGKLTNMYGPTETTIWSTTHHIEGVDGAVPIGRPIANTQIYILNDDRAPVPIGVPGELYIGGDGVTHGYLHRDQLTAERFLEDPFRTGGRMYRAGDLARYRPDGVIEFLGREDFQVKIRGHRIELGEIEATLERYDDIRAAVVTAQVRNDVKELVGYIVLASGGEALSAVDLRNRLRDSVPEFMIPTHLVVLDQLPLTPNGKVDRKALPKPGGQVGVEDRGFEAARNEVERKIIAIWEEVLDVQHIDRNGHFFDLGGNSLVALRLMDTMKTELGVGLPLRSIFDAPRVRDLATLIQEERVQTVGAERLSTVLEEVEQLSDDEVKRLLDS